jgi:hypothetical protein
VRSPLLFEDSRLTLDCSADASNDLRKHVSSCVNACTRSSAARMRSCTRFLLGSFDSARRNRAISHAIMFARERQHDENEKNSAHCVR